MKGSRLINALLILVSLAVLSSCASLVEEVTVFEDGSATLRFDLGIETEHFPAYEEFLPDGYELEDLFAAFINDDTITGIKFDRFTRGNRTWDSVEITVDDFMNAFGQSRKIGPLTIGFNEEEGNYQFTQTIDVANSTLIIPGVNLMDLKTSSYAVKLNTPQIVSSNGVQSAAGTSSWTVPLEEVLQEGSTAYLRANFSLEPYEGFFIPWGVFFPYLVFGFLALCFISILLVIIINSTAKKRSNEPTLRW